MALSAFRKVGAGMRCFIAALGLLATQGAWAQPGQPSLPSPQFATQPGTQNDNSVATTAHVKAAIQAAIGTTYGSVAPGVVTAGVLNVLAQGVPGVGQGPAAYTPANAVADTQAATAAFAQAKATPGTEIYFPCGNYSLNSPGTYGFQNFGLTTVSGATEACTHIFWNDAIQGTNLFTVAGSPTARPPGIYLSNMTIHGSWDTASYEPRAPTDPHLPGAPVYFDYAQDVHVTNVTVTGSRNFCFRTQNSITVQYDHIHAIKCSRDALSAVWSDDVSITNSSCLHNGDDGISVHSTANDPFGLRSSIVIAGNKLFDCGSIRVLGARKATIANNIMDLSKNGFIALTTSSYKRNDSEGVEALLDVTVTGNVGTGCTAFMVGGASAQKTTDPRQYACQMLLITADASGPGDLGNIPGMNMVAGTQYAPNGVIDPTPFYNSNPSSITGPTLPVPPTGRIVVTGNTFARTLPAADGTTAGFNSGADYSQKMSQGIFYESGWYTGPVDFIDNTPDAVQIKVGAFNSIIIDNNIFTGVVNCLNVLQGTNQIDNLEFAHNQCIDFTGAGVLSSSISTPLKALITENTFDGDPFYKNPLRSTNGTWLKTPDQTTQFPVGVGGLTGTGGFEMRGNHFKNLYRISNCDTSVNWQSGGGPCKVFWKDNIAEADPKAEGYNVFNRGIGVIDPEGGVIYTSHDYAPGDANWNSANNGPSIQMTAQSIPTQGDWVRNRRLVYTGPNPVTNGFVIEDYLRATTNAGNNAPNVDWITELKPVYQAAVTYTAPGPIAVNDNVSICNNTSGATIALTLAPGTPANDNLPHVFESIGTSPCTITGTVNGATQTVPWGGTWRWQNSASTYATGG